MQLPTVHNAVLQAPLPSGVGVAARVVSGNLAAIPAGSPVQATVASLNGQDAILTVNGQPLTIRLPPGLQLQQGAVLTLHVPVSAASARVPTLDLVGIGQQPAPRSTLDTTLPTRGTSSSATTAAPVSPTASPPPAPIGGQPKLVVVDVLGQAANGQVEVNIDGTRQAATAVTGEPLVAGGRYVLQSQNTPNGVVLTTPPNRPALATEIATAILRSPVPELGPTLAALRGELTSLSTSEPSSTGVQLPATVRAAAAAAKATLDTLIPTNPRPPNATELQNLIENGGQHFEAKLARLLSPTTAASTGTPAPAPTASPRLNPAASLPIATSPGAPALTTRLPNPLPVATSPGAPALTTRLPNSLPTPLPGPTAPGAPAVGVRQQNTNVTTELLPLVENETQTTSRLVPTTLPAVPTAGTSNEKAVTLTPADRPAPAQPTTGDKPTTDKPTTDKPTTESYESTANQTANPSQRVIGPDLKGDLLRLLQAVSEVSGAVQTPAAEGALRGIESQQASQALSQATGTAYYLQIPFPDGTQWRTVQLALEPEQRSNDPSPDRAGRFRVFMHVRLTDLGDTWIDAGLSGEKFRATIYLDRQGVRDRVRNALGDLRNELRGDGFSEVLLDVRAASDLPAGRRREAGALAAGRPASISVLDVKV